MFGLVKLQPSRLTNAYIVVAVLMLGAAVNFGLVRLRSPTQGDRTRREVGVSGAVWREGANVHRGGPRARATLENDRRDARQSRGRPKANRDTRCGTASAAEKEGSQASRRWRHTSASGITHEIFNSSDAG